ncbi:N-acyl-D-amino-acid deacylase family protein [Sphingomonas solaris]|uniref:Amidohydrolase family protein n=1 Tax=Alterirhizorhabdus solaris TaxID=2529389 RepID=A0A558RBQ7_9SPHN|nr:amidohydrolase family protein [Sphingomonas solaris]TVV76768.1 amidohydrolase family protein [Sphingomonas solaris]
MASTLIRGGMVADGDGGAPRRADVRFADGVITEVADTLAPQPGEAVVDATGLLVTPGFVDVHTHFDGQATWDSQLAPSCWHGVTTVVTGNCGVGFAPVRPGQQGKLIELMEGVEDIPGTALHEGMTWGWETFPQYLDVLGERRWMMDVGTQVPHAAVRAYVMGDRAATEQPTADDIAQMRDIVRDGMKAGALGISTSRMLAHRTSRGEVVPGTLAQEDELEALAGVLKELDTGVFEVVPRGMDGEISVEAHAEIDWMADLARTSGRPLVFSLVQTHTEADRWRVYLERAGQLQAEGVPFYPEVGPRPVGIVFGLQSEFTPFTTRPSFRALEKLPIAERLAELRRPEVRARILAEPNGRYRSQGQQDMHENFANMYRIANPINWEPTRDETMTALAAAAGVDVEAYLYDYLLGDDGQNLILYPYTNYTSGTLNEVHEMLVHPASRLGLGDAGAHCGIACDAGNTTLALAFWTRDRDAGPRIALGTAVRMMTRDTAELYGLCDRGRIAPGYRADLNLIDYERLELLLPHMVWDLPTGARRIMQRARGYVATFVAGERTIADDEATGALPGRLVRGARVVA